MICDVYVPISGLNFSGGKYEIAPGVILDDRSRPPTTVNLEKMVSRDEWEDAINSKYWLVYEICEASTLSDVEVMNLVFLSLWSVKPNRAKAKLRFLVGKNSSEGNTRRSRVLDRMEWNSCEENEEFSTLDMQLASEHYSKFSKIYTRGERLSNAMVLTLNGCWSHYWQSALISHAAAVETILTYSKGGITHKLAEAFACITESKQKDREAAYRYFKSLYNLRSDAIHGRIHLLESQERLPALAKFQSMLRRLWYHVLKSPTLLEELENSDTDRKICFQKITESFDAPSTSNRR